MKTSFLVIALLVASINLSWAQVPEPVLAQIRADIKASMQAKDLPVSDELIAKEISAFEESAKIPGDVANSFSFTSVELEAFQKGTPTPTDDELKKSVTVILELVGNPNRLPHLLAYYEALRASNKIAPAQRILHERTCRLVMANLKRHLGSNEPPLKRTKRIQATAHIASVVSLTFSARRRPHKAFNSANISSSAFVRITDESFSNFDVPIQVS